MKGSVKIMLKIIKEKQKEMLIALLIIVILCMYTYYRFFEVNTALKLQQRVGLHDVKYEQVNDMYPKELQGNLSQEEFVEFKKIIQKDYPTKIQQFIVFHYEPLDRKVKIEVTPGLNNMRIIDIEMEQ